MHSVMASTLSTPYASTPPVHASVVFQFTLHIITCFVSAHEVFALAYVEMTYTLTHDTAHRTPYWQANVLPNPTWAVISV